MFYARMDNVANMNTDGFKCQNTRLAVVERRGALTGRSSYGSKNQSTHAIGTRGSAANAG